MLKRLEALVERLVQEEQVILDGLKPLELGLEPLALEIHEQKLDLVQVVPARLLVCLLAEVAQAILPNLLAIESRN